MKKIILLLVLCTSGLVCTTTYSQVSLRVNISSQPIWGPVGYDHVDYYYLPDIEAYYYVPSHKYFYMDNGRWVGRYNLPSRYKNFDVYNSRRIVVNESKPYLRHNEFKTRYGNSNERSNQQSIRDSHETKYFENKKHPEHSKWKAAKKSQGKSQGRERRTS